MTHLLFPAMLNAPRRTARRIALVLALPLALAACGGDDAPETASVTPASATTTVLVLAPADVATATEGAVSSGIAITGTLAPAQVVEVKAQVSGTLGSVRFQEGDGIRRGTVLATIIAEGLRSQAASSQAAVSASQAGVSSSASGVSSARASVASAQAQLALARERAESAALLNREGAMSRLDLQAAQAQVAAAEAQLTSARSAVEAAEAQVVAARSQVTAAQSQATGAREQAARTVVTAPIGGAVSVRHVENGEAVQPGQTLYTLVSTGALELEGQVGVADAVRIRTGAVVEFTLDAYPGETFRGTVARVDPTADPETRQLGVHLRLPNNDGRLVGGLYATGLVLTEPARNALLVPPTAVRMDGDTAYVLTVENDRLARRNVTLLGRDEASGLTGITGPLRQGALVLASPTTDAAPGARVRIQTQASAGAARPALGDTAR